MELASSNTSLKKQAIELQVQQTGLKFENIDLKVENVELNAQVVSMRKELATFKAMCTAAKAETKNILEQMKFVAVNATLQTRVELMEEYKADQHVGWDLDFEIKVWKEREVALAGDDEAEEMAKELSSPMTEIPRLVEPAHDEVVPKKTTQVEVMPEHEEPRQEYYLACNITSFVVYILQTQFIYVVCIQGVGPFIVSFELSLMQASSLLMH